MMTLDRHGNFRSTSILIACALIMDAFAAASMAAEESLAAQGDLPVVQARSSRMDINDGGRLLHKIWTASPTVDVDVYYARRLRGERKITFTTDIDAISFKVKPGQMYDFIVLLEGKHHCRTRISTKVEPCRREQETPSDSTDGRIPFRIGADNKIHLTGRINDSEPLDLLFDMGADTTVLYPSALKKRAKIRVDGTTENAGTGGVATREFGNDNRIALGVWRWDQESVLLIEKQADRSDGIVGHNIFDDKVIAIDYDKMEIAILNNVPEASAKWTSLPIQFLGTIPAVPIRLEIGTEALEGWLVLDTGSSLSVHLNQRFAELHPFVRSASRLGSSRMRGVGSGEVVNEVFSIPKIELGNLSLANVPVHVEQSSDTASALGGHLGMDVLKRFNTILDFQKDVAYFSPSKLHADSFRNDYGGGFWWMIGTSFAISILLLSILLIRRRKLTNSGLKPFHDWPNHGNVK